MAYTIGVANIFVRKSLYCTYNKNKNIKIQTQYN